MSSLYNAADYLFKLVTPTKPQTPQHNSKSPNETKSQTPNRFNSPKSPSSPSLLPITKGNGPGPGPGSSVAFKSTPNTDILKQQQEDSFIQSFEESASSHFNYSHHTNNWNNNNNNSNSPVLRSSTSPGSGLNNNNGLSPGLGPGFVNPNSPSPNPFDFSSQTHFMSNNYNDNIINNYLDMNSINDHNRTNYNPFNENDNNNNNNNDNSNNSNSNLNDNEIAKKIELNKRLSMGSKGKVNKSIEKEKEKSKEKSKEKDFGFEGFKLLSSYKNSFIVDGISKSWFPFLSKIYNSWSEDNNNISSTSNNNSNHMNTSNNINSNLRPCSPSCVLHLTLKADIMRALQQWSAERMADKQNSKKNLSPEADNHQNKIDNNNSDNPINKDENIVDDPVKDPDNVEAIINESNSLLISSTRCSGCESIDALTRLESWRSGLLLRVADFATFASLRADLTQIILCWKHEREFRQLTIDSKNELIEAEKIIQENLMKQVNEETEKRIQMVKNQLKQEQLMRENELMNQLKTSEKMQHQEKQNVEELLAKLEKAKINFLELESQKIKEQDNLTNRYHELMELAEREKQNLKGKEEMIEGEKKILAEQKLAAENALKEAAEELERKNKLFEATREEKAKLEEAFRLEYEKLICIICCENLKNILFTPCNHIACCDACTVSNQFQTCPICRAPISSQTKVYAH